MFSARALLRAKAFTLTAIFTLALGMFLTVSVWVYSAWTIMSSAPYPRPNEVYALGYTNGESSDFIPFQLGGYFLEFRKLSGIFSEFAAAAYQTSNVVVDNEPVESSVTRLSEGTFKMLGITPLLGRTFFPEEFTSGRDDAVIISGKFWEEHFQSDPKILQRIIRIDDQVCRIVGVLRKDQAWSLNAPVSVSRPWVPAIDPKNPFEWQMYVLARLQPGVSLVQASTAMQRIDLHFSPEIATWLKNQKMGLRKPNQVYSPGTFRLLFGAAIFLFAVACLNVVNLMLVRVLSRGREFSIRRAIGGTRAEIVRLVSIEAGLISVSAGIVVYLCAGLFMSPLLALWTEFPYKTSFWNFGTAHGCLGVLLFISTLLLSATSAWKIRGINISPGLKDGSPAAGESRRTRQGRVVLVVLQAAFAVVLLAGAGLMIRTFQNASRVDLGLDPNGKLNVMLAFPSHDSPSDATRLQTFDDIENVFRHLSNVKAAGSGSGLNFWGFSGEGQPSLRMPDGTLVSYELSRMSEHYPEAAGLQLVRGRWMSQSKGAQEVVINESLAKRRFGAENPIGQVLAIKNNGADYLWTVAGVFHDVRAGLKVKAPNQIYTLSSWWAQGLSTVLVRYDRDPGPETEGVLRRAVYKINPRIMVVGTQTLNEQLKFSQLLARQALHILNWLSTVALVLATVGLFSVITYSVDRRKSEFGVRLALGAQPNRILWLVMRQGLIMAAAGVVVGCGAALGLARLMDSLLFETKPFEPIVYIYVATLLMSAAVVACWLPASRAARINISRLLRSE